MLIDVECPTCHGHGEVCGDGLIGRILELEDRLASAREIIAQIEPDFRHPPSPDSIERRIERARKWLAETPARGAEHGD